MISSFDVYLVMQLDSIRNALFGACFLGFMVIVWQWIEQNYSGMKWSVTVVLLIGAIHALMPSSKTAAAMILVPAMTSEQVTAPLTAEAKELYALAKQALVNVAQKPAEEPKPEVEK